MTRLIINKNNIIGAGNNNYETIVLQRDDDDITDPMDIVSANMNVDRNERHHPPQQQPLPPDNQLNGDDCVERDNDGYVVSATATSNDTNTPSSMSYRSQKTNSSCQNGIVGSDKKTNVIDVTNNKNDIEQFFLGKSISQNDIDRYCPMIRSNLIQILDELENDSEKQQSDNNTMGSLPTTTSNTKNDTKKNKYNTRMYDFVNMNDNNTIQCIPRSYQSTLLNIALNENIIVHLGTGAGKTLIAILLIREYMQRELLRRREQQLQHGDDDNATKSSHEKKIVVFLVPTIALAEQQSSTLAANLPCYTVGKVFGTIGTKIEHNGGGSENMAILLSEQQQTRIHLSTNCDVIVATHGCYLDLLNHYGDLFSINKCCLLIFDECHNCIGKSPYATIMRSYYHTANSNNNNQRPRILGLTASPLINVKKYHTDEQLQKALSQLENIMDSRIVSFNDEDANNSDANKSNSSDSSDNENDFNNNNKSGDVEDDRTWLQNKADEVSILYEPATPPDSIVPEENRATWPRCYDYYSYQNSTNSDVSLFVSDNDNDNSNNYNINTDNIDNCNDGNQTEITKICIHKKRQNDFNQLKTLYDNIGPLPVYLYCCVLYNNELARYTYVNETMQQFELAKRYIHDALRFCRSECIYYGRNVNNISYDPNNKSNSDNVMFDDNNDDEKSRLKQQEAVTYHPNGGLSNKLLELVKLLENEIELTDSNNRNTSFLIDDTHADVIGVVFVQQRITALALKLYFSHRRQVIEDNECVNNYHSYNNNEDNSNDSKLATMVLEHVFFHNRNNDNKADKYSQNTFSDMKTSDYDTSISLTPPKLETLYKNTRHVQSSSDDKLVGMDVDDDSRFMDADEDEDMIESEKCDEKTSLESLSNNYGDSGRKLKQCIDDNKNDQFADAEPASDPSYTYFAESSSDGCRISSARNGIIKCGALIRNPNDFVKSQSNYHKKSKTLQLSADEMQDPNNYHEQKPQITTGLDKKFLHSESDVKGVIDSFRRGEINVLIATSVVEEGIDVQACSFVVVFDAIPSIKSYIQMKGRARRKDAKFYLFQQKNMVTANATTGITTATAGLSLHDAREIEARVHKFIVSNNCGLKRRYGSVRGPADNSSNDSSFDENVTCGDERQAIENGFYEAEHGKVSLQTSKSLLYRFALQQPMDSTARLSKESFEAYLPSYDEEVQTLTLPSYIDSSLRVIMLPVCYWMRNKKDRESSLALMACVRLHKQGLLTDRLLPLSKEDIRKRMSAFTKQANARYDQLQIPTFPKLPSGSEAGSISVFVHKILMEGNFLEQARISLNGKDRRLAIITAAPLPDIPLKDDYSHKEFGTISFDIDVAVQVNCTAEELSIIKDFFALIINARWMRRTGKCFFRAATADTAGALILPYAVGCLDKSGSLDLPFMQQALKENTRDRQQRIRDAEAVSDDDSLTEPRLWCPLYDELSVYICYQPTNLTCASDFPNHEGISTYQDYFREKRNCIVPSDSRLMLCQRIWTLPINLTSSAKVGAETSSTPLGYPPMDESPNLCPHLRTVYLPKERCAEIDFIASAALYLEAILLPQILFRLERLLTANTFIDYCSQSFPHLATSLKMKPMHDVVGLLSAKSCCEADSYERLEWFGDAVLKLLQTDAIMKSSDLRKWIDNMHEGDLDAVRSALGSNASLEGVCRGIKFNKFVLTAELSRGRWIPAPLEQYFPATGAICTSENAKARGKICADIMEALVGFSYRYNGYAHAWQVAEELQLLIPSDIAREQSSVKQAISPTGVLAVAEALSFTKYGQFNSPRLVEEAFTHPTSPSPGISCYQRLEWIGDAVLCLAVRDWIFSEYCTADVGTMVLLEAPLVSNETFAFLSQRKSLHQHLRHRDPTLPERVASYLATVRDGSHCIWSTQPPKVLADILESVVGAVHVDGGFDAGQKAALSVLEPVIELYKKQSDPSIISHNPKRILKEVGGSLISLSNVSPDGALQDGSTTAAYMLPSKTVAVRCLEKTLVACAGDTTASAEHRTCCLLLNVLEQDEKLFERFTTARSLLSNKQKLMKENEANPTHGEA